MPSCHASSAVTHHNDDVLHNYIPFIFMSYSLLVLFTACALNRNIADDKIHTPHLMLKSWRLEKIEDTEYGCVGWRMENGEWRKQGVEKSLRSCWCQSIKATGSLKYALDANATIQLTLRVHFSTMPHCELELGSLLWSES